MKSKILLCFYALLLAISSYGQKGNNQTRSGSNFEYEGCGCDGEVDLIIYDGNTGGYMTTPQNYWGGNQVKKTIFGGRHEFDDGAITVANLNNTDGDGMWGDKDIDDTNAVIANPKGKDEVDLMKLEIVPKKKFINPCKVTLEYIGDIQFYSDSKKLTQLTDLEFDLLDGDGNKITTTLFVEARSVSSNMRDIVIKAMI